MSEEKTKVRVRRMCEQAFPFILTFSRQGEGNMSSIKKAPEAPRPKGKSRFSF